MPRLPRRQIGQSYTPAHVFQLWSGVRFADGGFGNDREAMRAAWPVLKDRVYALHEQRQAIGRATRERPWAVEMFDPSC